MWELSTGSVFAGHRIDAVAGRGGMGVVYRATQIDLGRTVALKLIAPELAEDRRLRDRFVNESRVAASIDHPHVIPIFYAGEEQGVLYIAMRYVVGTDLKRLVRADGPLRPNRAIRILGHVAEALDAAHACGLVHRDVKPANVLLTDADHAYLTDFGLTRHTSSVADSTQSGNWVGTLDYVAPEQIRGEHVDARSDVYALGCLFYFVLTAQVPFPREGDEAKLWAHLREEPPRASALAPDLPPQEDEVIARAMSKRPEDRFPSAGDVARAAVAAAEGRPVSQPERRVAEGPAAPWEGSTVTGTKPLPRTRADTAPTAAGRGSRRRLAAGIGAATTAAGVAAALVFSGGEQGAPKTTPTPSPSATATDTVAGRRLGTVPVGQRPNAITVAGRDVWVASFRSDSLTRLDARTGAVRDARLVVGRGATDVTDGYGSIWITNSRTRQLMRVGARTRRLAGPALALAQPPVSVVTGSGAVWVGTRAPIGSTVASTVVQVDPRGMRVVRSVPVPERLRGLAVGRGAVWVVTRLGLSRISIKTGEVRHVTATGLEPQDVAVGAGAVWVTNEGDNTVSKIELPTTRKVTIPVRSSPSHVAVLGDAVWVTSFGDHSVSRIDPRTSKVEARPVDVGRNPFALAVERDRVWVTQVADNTIARLSYR